MEIYLQEAFGIEKPFELKNLTARIFYKSLQLQQFAVWKLSDEEPAIMNVMEYIKGVILEENSPENVEFLTQLVSSLFYARWRG